jgi:hypothetical protein
MALNNVEASQVPIAAVAKKRDIGTFVIVYEGNVYRKCGEIKWALRTSQIRCAAWLYVPEGRVSIMYTSTPMMRSLSSYK